MNLLVGFGLMGVSFCCVAKSVAAKSIPARVSGVEVVNRFPHDPTAFTQGLIFSDGALLEGTGHYQKSQLREVELKTGKVLRSVQLNPKLFGEGITIAGDSIYQITWRSQVAIVYDRKTFREKRRFRYRGEGWGLGYDGKHLLMSNGTNLIQFRDPATFRVRRAIKVKYNSRPLSQLNELEYVNGEIYANIWHSEYIARINPKTGNVTGLIDISGLNPSPKATRRDNVANGIAYDASKKRLFITGKNWSVLYEIRIKQRN